MSSPNPNNPTNLPPRFQIRRLTEEHTPWAIAIVMHSNMFYSPLWPVVYPVEMTKRLHAGFKGADYLVAHQITSGMSFGVFDTEYEFKNPSSAATGGKLYWDESEPSIQESEGPEAEGLRLLKQMDFPLVGVALSYDGSNPLDYSQMGEIMQVLPLFGLLYHILAERDPRAPHTWQPTGPSQVLMRNATSTRHDYEGHKLMSGLARWLMREAAQKGYRGIQIETVNDAVRHVWANPPSPFKGGLVCEFDTDKFESEGDKPFKPSKVNITKCFVELREMSEEEKVKAEEAKIKAEEEKKADSVVDQPVGGL